MPSICICGGGSLGHAMAAVLGANAGWRVSVLTRRPGEWGSVIRAFYGETLEVRGAIERVSSDPAEVVMDADVVLLAMPRFAHAETLERIAKWVSPYASLGAVPGCGGFDWAVRRFVSHANRAFGLQRAPYVCRTVNYGRSVQIMGVSNRLHVACVPRYEAADVAAMLAEALNIPTTHLSSYLSVNLAHGNPVFHPVRLYSLFRTWEPPDVFASPSRFYADWNDAASEVYRWCDLEIQHMARILRLDQMEVPDLFQYYGVSSLANLTQRIRNHPSLRNIQTPMVAVGRGYIPDFNHRFFTEDIPFGLLTIRGIAEITGARTPMIDEIILWAQSLMGQQWLVGDTLSGPGTKELPLPRNFGISSVAELVRRSQ